MIAQSVEALTIDYYDRIIELSVNELDDGPDRETLANNIEVKEVQFFENMADQVTPLILQLLAIVKDIQDSKAKVAPVTPVAPAPAPPSHPTFNSRLAKLKFPTFSGDIRDYSNFKGQFEYFAKDLPAQEKLYQLTESMEKPRDKAKVKHCLDLSTAWSILDTEFGDNDRLIDVLIADIQQIDPYHTNEKISIPAMSKFVETLQNFTTHFNSLGMGSDLNSRVILTQLRRKLPKDHHMSFLEKVGKYGIPNMRTLCLVC